jgi:anti-sigma factor RsiW
MASCKDVDRLLTPYLDGEAGVAEAREVDAHLVACPGCAGRAAAERTARRVLRVRAEALSARAPDSLRRRCAALAPLRRPGVWAWLGWRPAALATASLVVLIVGATLAFGVVTHSPALLVAELTLDHLKCFALSEPHGPADPDAVAAQLQADYGWQLTIPASLPRERLTLMGARRCLSTDGTLAHVLYRHDGHPLSLFMLPRTSRASERIAMAGHVARIWSKDATTYVLLGGESDVDVQPVARYFEEGRR